MLVCAQDAQPISHDLHPILLALAWPARPHPLFLECHTGMGTEKWRLCDFSSSSHLAACEEPGPSPLTPPRVLLELLLGVPRSHPFSKAAPAHRERKRCHPSWLCWACCTCSKPFPECCPRRGLTSSEQEEVTALPCPTLPCPRAGARLLSLSSPATARCCLVLCSLCAARTLGLYWEVLSPTTSLFTHLIGHFSRCNIPAG